MLSYDNILIYFFLHDDFYVSRFFICVFQSIESILLNEKDLRCFKNRNEKLYILYIQYNSLVAVLLKFEIF